MRCASCKVENPPAAKFCVECGAAFLIRCPKCEFENESSFKFCAQCGESLQPPRPQVTPLPGAADRESSSAGEAGDARVRVQETAASSLDGERKTISALFADIKGSMEMMEDLDPEEARVIIDPALHVMMEAVRHYGGHVAQSTGDGIFALFGAPIAHEDHAQRALHAALRMQQEMRRYGDDLKREGKAPIEIRIGVNTGEVVVRSIPKDEGHAEYLPVGHSTGLAQRMQTIASSGAVMVTEHTHRLTEGYFQFRALGPTKVKGLTDPVNVYEVVGLGPLRTRLEISAQRGLSKFVGRNNELEAIRGALVRAESGKGQLVTAIGEPGVGKSRLFYEFKAIAASTTPPSGSSAATAKGGLAQQPILMLEAYAQSHGKASSYVPLIELLETYFEIVPGDDARRRREKVGGKVLMLDRTLEDGLPPILDVLGMTDGAAAPGQIDPQVRKRRILDALKRLLLRESIARPLVLIFEDLHWIDGETQSFLDLMVESIASSRILLLVNFRPEYRHNWGNKSYCTQLRLDPLGPENAGDMLRGLLGQSDELKSIREFVASRTEGNPFFIEEMVQALFDEGALVRNGLIRQAKPLNAIKLPPSVQGVLAARIDRLAPEDKELLQTLSVIGKEFSLRVIEHATRRAQDGLRLPLERLQASEFIYEQPAIGDTEYSFKHALTLEVAYNSMLMGRRKDLHEQVARAIEELHEPALDEHFGELAHHYGRSNNIAKAARYARLAGQRAYFRSDLEEAVRRLRTAQELLSKLPQTGERDRQEIPLQLLIGICGTFQGAGSDASLAAYRRALELSEETGDAASTFRALIGVQSTIAFSMGVTKSLEHAWRSLDLAQKTNDPPMLAEAHSWYGIDAYRAGDLLGARAAYERALELREKLPVGTRFYYTDPQPMSEGGLATVLWLLGFPDLIRLGGSPSVPLLQPKEDCRRDPRFFIHVC
jgi:class 3 adenylate cyclase